MAALAAHLEVSLSAAPTHRQALGAGDKLLVARASAAGYRFSLWEVLIEQFGEDKRGE